MSKIANWGKWRFVKNARCAQKLRKRGEFVYWNVEQQAWLWEFNP